VPATLGVLQMKTFVATPANPRAQLGRHRRQRQDARPARDPDRGHSPRASASPNTRRTATSATFVVVVNAERISVTGNKARRQEVLPAIRGTPAACASARSSRCWRASPRKSSASPSRACLPAQTGSRAQQLRKLKIYAGPGASAHGPRSPNLWRSPLDSRREPRPADGRDPDARRGERRADAGPRTRRPQEAAARGRGSRHPRLRQSAEEPAAEAPAEPPRL